MNIIVCLRDNKDVASLWSDIAAKLGATRRPDSSRYVESGMSLRLTVCLGRVSDCGWGPLEWYAGETCDRAFCPDHIIDGGSLSDFYKFASILNENGVPAGCLNSEPPFDFQLTRLPDNNANVIVTAVLKARIAVGEVTRPVPRHPFYGSHPSPSRREVAALPLP